MKFDPFIFNLSPWGNMLRLNLNQKLTKNVKIQQQKDQDSSYNFNFYIYLFLYFFNTSSFTYNSVLDPVIVGGSRGFSCSKSILLYSGFSFFYLQLRSSSIYLRNSTTSSSFLLYFFNISAQASSFCLRSFSNLKSSPLRLSSLSPLEAPSLTMTLRSFSRSVRSFLSLMFSQNSRLLSSLIRSVVSLMPISFPYSSSMYFLRARNYAFFYWYSCSMASFATPTWYSILEFRFRSRLSYSRVFVFNYFYAWANYYLALFRQRSKFFFVYSTVLDLMSRRSIFWMKVLWLPFTFSSRTLFLFIKSSSSSLSLLRRWSIFLRYSSDKVLEYSSNFFLHSWLTFTLMACVQNSLNLSISRSQALFKSYSSCQIFFLQSVSSLLPPPALTFLRYSWSIKASLCSSVQPTSSPPVWTATLRKVPPLKGYFLFMKLSRTDKAGSKLSSPMPIISMIYFRYRVLRSQPDSATKIELLQAQSDRSRYSLTREAIIRLQSLS